MSFIALSFISVFLLIMYWQLRQRKVKKQRRELIESYVFPERLTVELRKRYPHLSDADCDKVMEGLRVFFLICLAAKNRAIAMPSQAVDVVWHEFILFTRDYEVFCSKALGQFLHHTPAEAMEKPTQAQVGIQRAWKFSCLREGIYPAKPRRLPLLFAIDAELKIEDGFTYQLNCKGRENDGYCASHIGCGIGGCSSGNDSSSDSGSDLGSGSSCSSGCSGGGGGGGSS
ncbi:glycine-rich domain-containing protein [Neptuniibacter sp. QD57_21]|uniref:glycine-rich domain-containing protein n=1 Tax=Neptuniibacter sp. QD57_21 TaxID=3398213 RepID=UPI0039F4BD1E